MSTPADGGIHDHLTRPGIKTMKNLVRQNRKMLAGGSAARGLTHQVAVHAGEE